jgi:hypothetical protein
MDRLAEYRQIVRTFLMEYSKTKPINLTSSSGLLYIFFYHIALIFTPLYPS